MRVSCDRNQKKRGLTGSKAGVCVYCTRVCMRVCRWVSGKPDREKSSHSLLSAVTAPRLHPCSSSCLNELSPCPLVAEAVGTHLKSLWHL